MRNEVLPCPYLLRPIGHHEQSVYLLNILRSSPFSLSAAAVLVQVLPLCSLDYCNMVKCCPGILEYSKMLCSSGLREYGRCCLHFVIRSSAAGTTLMNVLPFLHSSRLNWTFTLLPGGSFLKCKFDHVCSPFSEISQ